MSLKLLKKILDERENHRDGRKHVV